MRAVVQRVVNSSVKVNEKISGEIDMGLNILLGVEEGDSKKDIEYMADKVANLRIFEDDAGKMNLSLIDVGGEALIISQFTLLGDCRKGRRPNFMKAGDPQISKNLYEEFCKMLEEKYNILVKTGSFREHMEVWIVNDGPVTLLIDSRKNF